MEIRISLICLIAFAKNIRQTSDIRIRFVGADIDAVIGLGVDTCDGCGVSDWFGNDACDGCGVSDWSGVDNCDGCGFSDWSGNDACEEYRVG